MFGDNPIRRINIQPGFLSVERMFYTIQGEGPRAGIPCVFIRLAGCNLACTFCDTEFETQANVELSVDQIVKELAMRFTPRERKLVVMTGGEPMRQNWSRLATWLLATGTEEIQVETAGTLWQQDLVPMLHNILFVCSPKTPKINQAIMANCHHWKYIVRAGEANPDDGLPDRGTQQATQGAPLALFRPPKGDTIWLSPCDEYDMAKNEANVQAARDLCLKHGYRLSLQMHKLIGVE